MVAKRFVSAAEIQTGKEMLVKIVSMLFGMIRANSDVRVFEETPSYTVWKAKRATAGIRIEIKSRNKNRR